MTLPQGTESRFAGALSLSKQARKLAHVCCFAFALALGHGCTHQVAFHPVEVPDLGGKSSRSVSLHIADSVRAGKHSFRSWGSGIANSWQVAYGERVEEYARAYLGAVFSQLRDASSADDRGESDWLIRIGEVDYNVEDQAAHIALSAQAVDKNGSVVVRRKYSSKGWSGQGAIRGGGGAFAQKAVTRSSTNEALDEIFRSFVTDLRNAGITR